jgi:hypothetical protein
MAETILAGSAARAWHGDDRVRRNTAGDVNRRLDRELRARVRFYASQPAEAIDVRLGELEREWDVERWLALNASAVMLGSLALAALKHRGWLLLSGAAAGFLLQHAVQGWCPPLALFRRLGIRTRQEIDAEIVALKALRGDFVGVPPESTEPMRRADAALRAVEYRAGCGSATMRTRGG